HHHAAAPGVEAVRHLHQHAMRVARARHGGVGRELLPRHRVHMAIQAAVAAGRTQVGDAAPVAPQRAPPQLGGGGGPGVGEGRRRHLAQAVEAKPAGEQVVAVAVRGAADVVEHGSLRGGLAGRGGGGGSTAGERGQRQRGGQQARARRARGGCRERTHVDLSSGRGLCRTLAAAGARHIVLSYAGARSADLLPWRPPRNASRAMTDLFLAGRTALVTGSTSGIGLAIACSLAAAGARVAVNGLGSPEQVDAALAAVRAAGAVEARHFDADLRDPAAIAAMMAAVEAWSPVDVLVNNAGIQHTAALADMPVGKWDDIIAINLSAAFHTMRAALPGMAARGYGRVVNVASVHGLVASKEKAPYVAAKHGIVGLSRVAALEYAAAGSRDSGGVTVNCICPGWVETPLIEPQ